jgi:uncharacterized protein (DUF2141 family)
MTATTAATVAMMTAPTAVVATATAAMVAAAAAMTAASGKLDVTFGGRSSRFRQRKGVSSRHNRDCTKKAGCAGQ